MLAALLLIAVRYCHAAPLITVQARPTPIYHSVANYKLRIQGTGFSGDGAGYHLSFYPEIDANDFKVVVASDTVLSLNLVPGKVWPMLEDAGESGSELQLIALRDDKVGSQNLLDEPVAVAQVIRTPAVMDGGDKVIYMTLPTRFNINGTGFRQKKTELTFDPPLEKDVDYIIQVRSPTFIQLTLRTGRKWRSDGEAGPLKLKKINTGAGPLLIDAKFGGVMVAEVQADLGPHGVTVESSPDTRIYQSTPTFQISGSGFNTTTAINSLKWGNSLRGKGVNYTIVSSTSKSLTLSLQPGSHWRANAVNLPGPLKLLAVNAGGAAPVPVGPTEQKKGRVVATVYEDPTITPNPTKTIFLTHTHELWITGTGFVRSSTKFTFDPPLSWGADYVSSVFNRTHVLVSLMDGRKWSPTSGILRVTAIDTGAGNVRDFKPVPVAHVSPDQNEHASGISITRTASQTLYQTSSQSKTLLVTGTGLCSEPAIVFDPPLVQGTDYVIAAHQSDQLQLKQKPGKLWHPQGGALAVVSLSCPDAGQAEFAYGTGIVVATILPNPKVDFAERRIYSTHTKSLVIKGSGFSLDSTHVVLRPTPPSAYDTIVSGSTEIVLTLKESKSWLPPNRVAPAASTDIAIGSIYVEQVDTGAGYVPLGSDEDGVEIAQVFDDPDGAVCDDSCEWSFDGVCDDGSVDAMRVWEDDNRGSAMEYDDDYYQLGYYYYDDTASSFAPVCEAGTDCTDCGAMRGPDDLLASRWRTVECDNSCTWSNDNYCDDTRSAGLCALGTDCHDCGPASQSNFTSINDDGWWDDDAAYWDDDYDLGLSSADDLMSVKKPAFIVSLPNPKTKNKDLVDNIGVAGIFMLVLEGIVVGIGAVMCSIASYFAYRYHTGKGIPFQLMPTEGTATGKPASAVPITPDISYSGTDKP